MNEEEQNLQGQGVNAEAGSEVPANPDNSGDEDVTQGLFEIIQVIEEDALLSFLIIIKMKIKHGSATKEEIELYNKLHDGGINAIKGEAMNNEQIQEDVKQTQELEQDATSGDNPNDNLKKLFEFINETHQPKEGYEGSNDIMQDLLSGKDHPEIGQLREANKDAKPHELLKMYLDKKRPAKKETAVVEENEIGKNLSATKKEDKPLKKRYDWSSMSKADRERIMQKIYKKN